MNKELSDFITEKTHELIQAPSCSAETKKSAEEWLAAEDKEKAAAKYIAELEEDIMPVDGLIQFAKSEQGKNIFGEAKAKEIAKHAEEIKAAGAVYCDCPACAAAAAILAKKAEILA